MRELLFQIVLFVASTFVAVVIQLLKPHRLTALARYCAFTGISISLAWGGYEFGSRQKEPVLKEKEALADRQEMNPPPDLTLTAKSTFKGETSKTEINNRKERAIKKIVTETDSKDIEEKKNTNSPIVLEPTWVTSGASVHVLSGQVMIRIRDYFYYNILFNTVIVNHFEVPESEVPDTRCDNSVARVDINIPDSQNTHACLNIGDRAPFTYKEKVYWINLLDSRYISESLHEMPISDDKNLRPQFMISVVTAL